MGIRLWLAFMIKCGVDILTVTWSRGKRSTQKGILPSTTFTADVPEVYDGPVVIKPAKVKDLIKLSQHLPPENMQLTATAGMQKTVIKSSYLENDVEQ